jgi:DNA-binding NtrC family response regulator
MAHLLLVDDEEALRSVVAERLTDEGFQVTQATDGESALKALDSFAFDVIISDLRLPGVDGRQVIESALQRYPSIVAIVVTGYGTVKDAVDMIKLGAADFIAKPFQFDELMHVLSKALEQRRLKSENAYLHQQLDERFGIGSMVGKSAPMRSLYQLIETVAPTTTTILITGETGTGKEMVARAIHQTSTRHRGRFVAINVSAIPETLLDAELFGHVRGAFTGAVAMRQGRLEQADGGTLFLDEVGTMPMALQMKMLRVLQEREFERIGDTKTIKVDVRIVAATNADLAKMVKDGTFREDLYYRLNVIPVHLAPLRDRVEDIPLLVSSFVKKFAGDRDVTVSQDAMRRLMAYGWPGNVRQLENTIERAIAMSGGRSQIDVAELPAELQSADETSARPLLDLPSEGVDLPALVALI